MNRIFIKLTLIALILCNVAYAASRSCTDTEKQAGNEKLLKLQTDPSLQAALQEYHLPLGIHLSPDGDNEPLLHQSGYLLKHDGDLRTALWVTYRLNHDDITGATGKDRVNCFRKDPRLTDDHAALTTDYKEPIFDQGHMANDADLKDQLIDQINSYVMSNISPQRCRFNRGIWLSLEHLTREWAKQYETIYVTSGAIFDRDKDAKRDQDPNAERMVSNNGKARVAVASHFYKVIFREDDDGWKAIAFLLEHNNLEHGSSWDDVRPDVFYAISQVGVIEAITGTTLHPNLDRQNLSQSFADWDFSTSDSNFEGSCN